MFAIVDLETTGGNASRDRITEVAVVLHDGEGVVRRFSSLVNPEISIPPYITDITGITDEMVADAPFFREIADEILEMTDGAIFVAHNVGFDYGFLRESFLRLGLSFHRNRLCTVRASRRLIPGLPSYSLGKLCAHLGIEIKDRHRALGDADATALLLDRLLYIEPGLKAYGKDKSQDPFEGLPEHLDRHQLGRIPETPGIFFLHGSTGEVDYVARARNLRRDLFRKVRELTRKGTPVGEVSWEPTGSELLAVLRLPAETAAYGAAKIAGMPRGRDRFGVYAYRDQRNYLRLYTAAIKRGTQPRATFPGEAEAQAALAARVREFQLCPALCGLDSQPCAGGTCGGACQAEESPEAYNLRVEQALEGLGFPYPRFFVLGRGRSEGELSVVCVENGACLGYAYLDAGQSWSNPETVRGLLEPFAHPKERAFNVRQLLPKLTRERIVPY